MSISSIGFRESRIGLEELKKNAGQLPELLEEYSHGKRYRDASGILCICFNEAYIAVENVETFLERFNKIYDKYLRRGYDLKKIESDKDGFFYLGYFEEDDINCPYTVNDFCGVPCNKPNEIITLCNNTQIVEVYKNGLIARDLPSDSTYYFSPEDLGYFIKIDGLNLDIRNAYIRHYGNPHRRMYISQIDGLEANRMKENFREVPYKWLDKNKYNRGYCISGYRSKDGKGRFTFTLCGVRGRDTDTEAEACTERYVIEQKLGGGDCLFNPAYNHINQRYLLERYIRGEITSLDLVRDTLTDVAQNPYLILRYHLEELCRQLCVVIEPFKLDRGGMIVNQNGVSFSALAELYFKGMLTQKEIYRQGILKDISELSCKQ